ncbi:MAG: NUDIX domain-containing protein [Patescibacteria group bacterium]|nr:NUDIX domain-containing protein [Patescibacteria group bacterium]
MKLKKSFKKKFRREFSAGGIVYKTGNEFDSSSILWLVTKATPSAFFPENYWRFPKGWLDDAGNGMPGPLASGAKKATEEEIREAAIREVKEEAGIEARIIKKLGTIKYSFNDKNGYRVLKFVTFYLMKWECDLPQGFGYETSEVRWVDKYEVLSLLANKNEKIFFENFIESFSNFR